MIIVSSNHKTREELHQELDKAKDKVKVGGIYAHYKHPDQKYQVISLGFIEANDEMCVIYRAKYDEELTFVRPVISWLETPEWEGEKVSRFKLISNK